MAPSTAAPKKRTTNICETCLKVGHSADRCWKTYPDLRPPRSRTKQKIDEQELPECAYCGEVGHIASECWIAHPELQPRKGDPRRKDQKKKRRTQAPKIKCDSKLGPFNIRSRPQIGWVRFPKEVRCWVDEPEYARRIRRRVPSRCVISLALNEVGRRLQIGMVYWTKTLRDDAGGRFDLLYVGKRWSEGECKAWDMMTHEKRVKARDAVGVLNLDEMVVPVAVAWRYMELWVGEELDDGEGHVECEIKCAATSKEAGALLLYESARAGTDNPPSVDRYWRKNRRAEICGVPHLSSIQSWANCGGSDRDGISWADNLKWMAMAVREGNEGVMQGLQEMWDGGEDGVAVLHRDVED